MGDRQEEESRGWLPGRGGDPEAAQGRPEDPARGHLLAGAAPAEPQRDREQHRGEHRRGDQRRVQPVPEEEHRHGVREERAAQGRDGVQGGRPREAVRRRRHQDALRAHQVLQGPLGCVQKEYNGWMLPGLQIFIRDSAMAACSWQAAAAVTSVGLPLTA